MIASWKIVRFEGRDEKDFDGQWIAAKDLRVGDKCLLSDNKTAIITSVKTEKLAEPFKTYNFEVADFHTYFVGEQSVLVHNACSVKAFDKDQQAVIELAKEADNVGGIVRADANTLVGWAKEYGIKAHFPDIHLNRPLSIWSKVEHINILNMHIPVI